MNSLEYWEDLKKPLDYKWRVQGFFPKENPTKCRCVAYVDSRDVQNRLDYVVGPENWQDEYQEIAGNLYCRIGIRTDDGWVWKGDCGTVSKEDPEKGQASDAFKRAAVKWGIGRFLYSLGFVILKAKKDGKYSNPVDDNGNKIWDVNKHINGTMPPNNPPSPPPKQLPPNPNINAQRQRAIDLIKASGHDIIQAQADYNKAKEAGACQEALDILQGHVDSLTDNN